MRFYLGTITLAASMLLLGGGLTALPAAAQEDIPGYTTWQPGWDTYQYDRQHVILGRVNDFHPYRLSIIRRNGNEQMIDLKNGTVIYPTGSTPMPGERVAIVGYYSDGTFIANRVIIRS